MLHNNDFLADSGLHASRSVIMWQGTLH